MKLFSWLSLETRDVARRIRAYPRFRLVVLALAMANLWVFLLVLWSRITSPWVGRLDSLVDYSVLGTDWIKFFFEGVSFLGSAYFVVSFSCLVCIWLFRWRQRRVAVTLMILLGGSSLAGSWLKGWFERPRPFFCLADTLATNGCLSFPSGHAATAVYFYGLLAFLVFRFGSWRLKKFLRLVVGAAGFIGLIGLSRVVLRVHYPSDVIGGFLLGMVFLLLAILLIEVFYYEKK